MTRDPTATGLFLVAVLGALGCASVTLPPSTHAPTRAPPHSATASPRTSHLVSGIVRTVHHYCASGGAMVPPEVRAAAERPEPRPGTYAVVAGARISGEAPAARFRADADGRFSLQLPAGEWCIYDPATIPEAPASAVASPYYDLECLQNLASQCASIIQVGSTDVTDVSIDYWDSCPEPFNHPCWRGPLPP